MYRFSSLKKFISYPPSIVDGGGGFNNHFSASHHLQVRLLNHNSSRQDGWRVVLHSHTWTNRRTQDSWENNADKKKKCFQSSKTKKNGHVCPPSLWRPFWTSLEFYYLKKTNGLWFFVANINSFFIVACQDLSCSKWDFQYLTTGRTSPKKNTQNDMFTWAVMKTPYHISILYWWLVNRDPYDLPCYKPPSFTGVGLHSSEKKNTKYNEGSFSWLNSLCPDGRTSWLSKIHRLHPRQLQRKVSTWQQTLNRKRRRRPGVFVWGGEKVQRRKTTWLPWRMGSQWIVDVIGSPSPPSYFFRFEAVSPTLPTPAGNFFPQPS